MRLLALIVGVVVGYALKVGIDRISDKRTYVPEQEWDDSQELAHHLYASEYEPEALEW